MIDGFFIYILLYLTGVWLSATGLQSYKPTNLNMSKQFTDQNFNSEVLEASKQKPVLVDFFAPWCGPCKIQGPIVDELAGEIGDKAVVGKLNTEEAQQTAMNFGIMSIPTLMIFKNGEVKETMVGLQSKEGLRALLEKYGA